VPYNKPMMKGARKRTTVVFKLKSHFAWRKSATKFICMKTVSDKVVRHSLAVRKWFVGDVPFNVKICRILTHPLATRWFSFETPQPYVTPSKKFN